MTETTLAGGRRPRCVVLMGAHGAGKTALFDAMLAAAGVAVKRGGARPFDGHPHDLTVAHADMDGDPWTLIDAPGAAEFQLAAQHAAMIADVAVVVVDPDPERAAAAQPSLRFLEARDIPHVVFINKMDQTTAHVRDVLQALQGVSKRKLALRQIPIRDGEKVTGYVDLISERAYRYRPGEASELIAIPQQEAAREQEARAALMETLADYDDALLEKLIGDAQPSPSELYDQLHKDLAADLITEVLIGAATTDAGVRRLWKMLRHDAPTLEESAAARWEIDVLGDGPLAAPFRIVHAPHVGKLTIARVARGEIKDGQALSIGRIGGLYHLIGGQLVKIAQAEAGDVVAMGKLEDATPGQPIGAPGKSPRALDWPQPTPPVYALAIKAVDRHDDVKLSAALEKILEEDPSLRSERRADHGEIILAGQGEAHLREALERLEQGFGVKTTAHPPQTAYRETIRKHVHHHARHKRQTGGHGQFADIKMDFSPRHRGEGLGFEEKVVGGAVPRQFIPAVEEGVMEQFARGPLGFPVVDVLATLLDGQHHSVDSSDQAFKTAAMMAVREGLAEAEPYLLEPILKVDAAAPAEFTGKVQRILNGRRGQLLGFDAHPELDGWDVVSALVPEAEIHDLIIELRSATLGLGGYVAAFDHLEEARGKAAERALAAAAAA